MPKYLPFLMPRAEDFLSLITRYDMLPKFLSSLEPKLEDSCLPPTLHIFLIIWTFYPLLHMKFFSNYLPFFWGGIGGLIWLKSYLIWNVAHFFFIFLEPKFDWFLPLSTFKILPKLWSRAIYVIWICLNLLEFHKYEYSSLPKLSNYGAKPSM